MIKFPRLPKEKPALLQKLPLGNLPPVPTLALAGLLTGTALAAPYLMAPPETAGLAPGTTSQTTADAVTQTTVSWTGPRAEAKREILIAPLFTEDRKLPDPFAEPEPEIVETPADEPNLDLIGMNPPEELPTPALEEPPDEELMASEDLSGKEEEAAEPAKPLVLPELRLVGTFILESKGIARALLIEAKDDAEETWVDEDGSYKDWTLTIVSPSAVRLVGGEESLTLELWVEEEKESGESSGDGNDGSVTGTGGTPGMGFDLGSGEEREG